jgi:hypothetical protein
MSVGPATIERIACRHTAGSIVYCIVIREDSHIYNGSGFEAATVAGWPGYAVPLADAAGVGIYSADVPTAIVGGYYRVFAHVREGDIPAPSDPVVAAGTIGELAAGTTTPAEPPPPPEPPVGPPVGPQPAGPVAVDHDTGGTDAMRFVGANGAGIAGASVRIYDRADWDAGRRAVTFVRASTGTRPDGRWTTPLMLDPGDHVVLISYPGFQPSVTYITV